MNKLKNTKKSAAFDRSSLIINLFREFPNNKFSLKHLASASGGATKEGRLRTREIITELLAQGTIEECGQEKYRLSGKERPRQEGIVQMISTGAMYIRSEEFEKRRICQPAQFAECSGRRPRGVRHHPPLPRRVPRRRDHPHRGAQPQAIRGHGRRERPRHLRQDGSPAHADGRLSLQAGQP